MLHSSFTPMRTTIGKAVKIQNVTVLRRSKLVEELGLEEEEPFGIHLNLEEALNLDFSAFLPEWIMTTAADEIFTPIEGVNTHLPAPSSDDFPFNNSDDVISMRGLLDTPKPKPGKILAGLGLDPRDMWIELKLKFESEQLIGGICYSGHSSLPYYVTSYGENSANFGLPRELRLSWASDEDNEFLDDLNSVTVQEPLSHNGVHYLCTGPIKTDHLILRLSDFPRFLKFARCLPVDKSFEIYEKYGFLIPLLYVFEYKEGTRHHPHVSAGILAALKSPPKPDNTYFSPFVNCELNEILGHLRFRDYSNICADFVYSTQNPDSRYFPLSEGSLIGRGRTYRIEGLAQFTEIYCSPPIDSNENIMLFVEQAEEHARCLAGIKMQFAFPQLEGLAETPKLKIKVFELDPLEGASPIISKTISAVKVGDLEKSKYAYCIYDNSFHPSQTVNTHKLRFIRSSNSRYLAIALINDSDRIGQIAINRLELVQSAHVAIVPRITRTQTIDTLYYRLIGSNLGDDYARLGSDGFSIAVERLVAGQRKEQLFSANSLLDLLQTGTARLYTNHRRMETIKDVTKEIVTTEGGYDDHTSKVRSEGWRRSETGDGVEWASDQLDAVYKLRVNDFEKQFSEPPQDGYGFLSLNNAEVRSHVEHIGDEGWGPIADDVRKLINEMAGEEWIHESELNQKERLLQYENNRDGQSFDWEGVGWKGLNKEDIWVGSLRNVTLPPWAALRELADPTVNFIRSLKSWIVDPLSAPQGPEIEDLINVLNSLDDANEKQLLNGISMGFSVGVQAFAGGSFSIGGSSVFPQTYYSESDGTSGNIIRQASKAGYSYAQHLNRSFDRSRVITEYSGGSLSRKIARELNAEGTQKERKRGAEVMWNNKYVDIVTGSIPLGITIPAIAGDVYRTTDEALRVRFGNGIGKNIEVDVWFDLEEEVIRDDF